MKGRDEMGKTENNIVTVLVENNAGVLARVVSLFGRRGYNIESLTVATTKDKRTSYITIVVNGDKDILDQIIKQVSRLEETISVRPLEESRALSRELLLIKFAINDKTLTSIHEISSIYGATIVDLAPDTMIVELTRNTSKIDAFLSIMKKYDIIEICRTGVTALERDSQKLK